MQLKTSSIEFEKYGNVYVPPMPEDNSEMMVYHIWNLTSAPTISQVVFYDCDVYIELQTGLSNILIGSTPEINDLQVFGMHRGIHIKPYMYFALSPISYNITYKIIHKSGEKSHSIILSSPYRVDHIRPQIRISEILGHYYSDRSSGYHFLGDSHNCYELTYVDRGNLVTSIDSEVFRLGERELILYGPGQFHTQRIEEGNSCSYITILFDMEMTTNSAGNIYDKALLNKVFHYDKHIYSLIKSFVAAGSEPTPYANSLLICHLQEIIIRMLISNMSDSISRPPSSDVRENYKEGLMDNILSYIEEAIFQPITISDLCQTFSLSRSYIQLLFNENIGTTPKKYINNQKLEKSKQLINEHRYSISEIAIMLGYNSIHYFSRSFTKQYGISPSEYAKQLYNLK